jgi:hypothetical protein
VNLTRFSLFFPEKREFFTENQGTFAFGGAGGVSGVPNGDGGETPLLFYSRRIGLEYGLEVPILAGARLTGRVGRTSVGVIEMQTRDAPAAGAEATNFQILRARRDILNRSAVGALVTSRSVARNGGIEPDHLGRRHVRILPQPGREHLRRAYRVGGSGVATTTARARRSPSAARARS